MRELRLPGNLTTAPAALATLRAEAPGVLHVVDPYKVPLAQAVEKAQAIADLGHRVLLVGSTDNPAFDEHVAPYVAGLRERTDLTIVLHFPPVPGRGAPLCAGADGVFQHNVLNSTHPYFVSQSEAETVRELAKWGATGPVPIRSASFAFGADDKTQQAVASTPTAVDAASLEPFLQDVVTGDYDVAYLLSRHGAIDLAVCRHFRERLAPHQLLFAGGGVRSRRQAQEYIDSGVDWVVVGNGLEEAGWRDTLHQIAGARVRRIPRPRRSPDGDRAMAAELQRGLAAPLGTTPAQRQQYATNVGGVSWQVPALVARVSSADEVSHVLSTTRAAGIPVGIRGTGHSFGPQALSDGGVLIVPELGDPELVVHPDGTAEVSARTAWHAVETGLNALGRAVPVLTNHLTVSVGGTLSVGGYGEGTVTHGGQVDLVERFRLIRPDGQAVWCSPSESPELFRYGLASLGQLGVLDRVVLRTVPYEPVSSIVIGRAPSLTALVKDLEWLADADPAPLDYFCAQHGDEGMYATYGVRGDRPLPARLTRGAEVSTHRDWPLRSLREARRNPADPSTHFVWTDYCLELPAAERFARFVEREVIADPAFTRYRGRVLVLAANHPERRPGVPFSPAAGLRGLVLGFGLYFHVPKGDAAGLARVQSLHRRAMDVCLGEHGRPYLAGWHDLTEADKQRLWGGDLQALRRLRRELDPSGLLNPGLLA